jgi:hypothetical protein
MARPASTRPWEHPTRSALAGSFLLALLALLVGPDLARAVLAAAGAPGMPGHGDVARVTRSVRPRPSPTVASLVAPAAPVALAVAVAPAALVAPAARETFADGVVRGVAESRDGVVAVAWTARGVYVTRDGGDHFAPALASPGQPRGAVVTDRGDVLVVRRPRALGVARADGSERWETLPRRMYTPPDVAYGHGDALPFVAMASRGAWVAMVVVSIPSGYSTIDAWMATTADLGRTFQLRRLNASTEWAVPDVGEDGVLRLFAFLTDCSYDALELSTHRPDGRTLSERALELEVHHVSARFDREGWLHLQGERCDAGGARCRTQRTFFDDALHRRTLGEAERLARRPWFSVADGVLVRRTPGQGASRVVLRRAPRASAGTPSR